MYLINIKCNVWNEDFKFFYRFWYACTLLQLCRHRHSETYRNLLPHVNTLQCLHFDIRFWSTYRWVTNNILMILFKICYLFRPNFNRNDDEHLLIAPSNYLNTRIQSNYWLIIDIFPVPYTQHYYFRLSFLTTVKFTTTGESNNQL